MITFLVWRWRTMKHKVLLHSVICGSILNPPCHTWGVREVMCCWYAVEGPHCSALELRHVMLWHHWPVNCLATEIAPLCLEVLVIHSLPPKQNKDAKFWIRRGSTVALYSLWAQQNAWLYNGSCDPLVSPAMFRLSAPKGTLLSRTFHSESSLSLFYCNAYHVNILCQRSFLMLNLRAAVA